MKAPNYIKCKYCEWKTNKWGKSSNPHKAFKRLRHHLVDYHLDKVDDDMLDMMEENVDMECEP